MRRKQWEYRSQAVNVINAYAEAMQPRDNAPRAAHANGSNVDGTTMLAALGVKGLT